MAFFVQDQSYNTYNKPLAQTNLWLNNWYMVEIMIYTLILDIPVKDIAPSKKTNICVGVRSKSKSLLVKQVEE